jgi:hypothetical protein
MITSPICQIKTPKATALRTRKFKDFRAKYPSAFYAWVERQSSKSVRRYWAAVLDPYLLPELKVLLAPAHEPVTSQDLWDAWYRSSLTCLVHPKRGRLVGDFTDKELAQAFGIKPGRYQGLVEKEKAWRKRPHLDPKPMVRPGLIANQPDIEDLIVRLFK